jgi:hypothetical protein
MESSTDVVIPCAVKNCYYCGKEHCFQNAAMILVQIRYGSKELGNCYAVAADYFEVFGIAGCFVEPRIVDYSAVVDYSAESRIVDNYAVVGCFEVLDIADCYVALRIADNY